VVASIGNKSVSHPTSAIVNKSVRRLHGVLMASSHLRERRGPGAVRVQHGPRIHPAHVPRRSRSPCKGASIRQKLEVNSTVASVPWKRRKLYALEPAFFEQPSQLFKPRSPRGLTYCQFVCFGREPGTALVTSGTLLLRKARCRPTLTLVYHRDCTVV
jgi:hypothetical protein